MSGCTKWTLLGNPAVLHKRKNILLYTYTRALLHIWDTFEVTKVVLAISQYIKSY